MALQGGQMSFNYFPDTLQGYSQIIAHNNVSKPSNTTPIDLERPDLVSSESLRTDSAMVCRFRMTAS